MKTRILSIVLALMTLITCFLPAAAAEMGLVINGEEAVFIDAQGNPLDTALVDGRLYVPAVAMGQHLGLDIRADAEAKTVFLAGQEISFASGGMMIEPAVIDGVVYVPLLSFVSVLKDCTVDIKGNSYHINIKGATEYRQGEIALRAGDYENARACFAQAGQYADAAQRISGVWYQEAEDLLGQGQYDAASDAFTNAGTYMDAPERVYEPFYHKGQKLQKEGKWTEAAAAYAQAGKYQDAAELAAQMLDQAAGDMIAEGDYKAAYAAYSSDGSVQSIQQLFYRMAQAEQAAGRTEAALACYELAGDYQDAKQQYQQIAYQHAAALEAAGQTEKAIAVYQSVGDVLDAQEKWKKLTYDLARKKQNSEKYDEAYALYDTIRGYSDVDSRLTNSSSLKSAAKRVTNSQRINGIKVGDTFTYGSYVLVDSNSKSKQPIEWQVVKKNGAKVLVMSRYALAKKPYHTSNTKSVNWSNCSLRTWLNGSFANSAFTEAERKAIVSTSISSMLSNYDTVSTKDKVFLLSQSEYKSHLHGDGEVAQNKRGSKVDVWTRDRYTRNNSNYVTYINTSGTATYSLMKTELYVCPAMWLNLESTAVDWSKCFKTDAEAANKYAVIERLIAAGKYEEALDKLSREGTSTEVTALFRECWYQQGLQALRTGDPAAAKKSFDLLMHLDYKHTKEIVTILNTIK